MLGLADGKEVLDPASIAGLEEDQVELVDTRSNITFLCLIEKMDKA